MMRKQRFVLNNIISFSKGKVEQNWCEQTFDPKNCKSRKKFEQPNGRKETKKLVKG